MWNIRGKCFLFSMFMLLRPSHQILNVVALVKETSLFFPSANGREQFLSKNNSKIICLRVYKILEGFFFVFVWDTIFSQVSSTLHKYGWIYSDCSSVWKEIDPVQPYRRWAWHRQEEEPHQPYWYACLCLNKDDAQALALLKRSSGTCFSSFPAVSESLQLRGLTKNDRK